VEVLFLSIIWDVAGIVSYSVLLWGEIWSYALTLCGWLGRIGRDSLWPEGGKACVIFLMKGFFYPCIGCFHMPLEFFFSTQVVQWRCLVVITFVNIKYLGLAEVGKNSNSFFSQWAWKPAILTVELSAEGPGEKLTSNIKSRAPSPICIPSVGFLTVATVQYRGAVGRGEQKNQWWFRLSVYSRCITVSTCQHVSRYAGQN
jgi:hypothetical protein